MSRINIGKSIDLVDNKLIAYKVNQRTILVVKSGEEIISFDAVCPHQGADLSQGEFVDGYITCPMHGKRFNCVSGKEVDRVLCLSKYEVTEEAGELFFETGQLLSGNSQNEPRVLTKIKDLPSPKGSIIGGNLSDFKKVNKHQVVEGWVKEVGELFTIRLMTKQILVSALPEFNNEVLKNRPNGFRRFSKIKEVMEEMGIVGVFSSEGEQWKRHRKMTAEALSMRNVRAFFPTIEEMTQRLINRWEGVLESQEVIDIQKEMMLYTVDITTNIAFGYDTNSLQSEGDIIQEHLNKIFPMVNKRIVSPIPVWRYIKSKKDIELETAVVAIQNKVTEIVAETKNRLLEQPERKQEPENFLEALLVAQEKDVLFTDKEIFGNVFTLLLAGEDTTSNSISWALYLLLKHPDKWKKIQDEIDTVLGDRKLPESNMMLDRLKYTEAVTMETLRLKPTTPTLIMESNEDVIIEGIQIPKDTTILMQNKVAQTAEMNFSEPEIFLPERWLEESGCPHGNHKPDSMRVFGAGPRFCPGKQLAMHEMKMALAAIVKNFNLDLQVGIHEVNEVFAFTMYPENLKVKLRKRRFSHEEKQSELLVVPTD